MTYADVIKVVDQLSADELRELKAYIQQREQQIELRSGTLNMEVLLAGLEQMREGLSDQEYAEIERAMNEEYVEPLDHNQ
jgi:hypothetical protein